MAIALCCDDVENSEKIKEQIASISSASVHVYTCDSEFITAISNRPDLIMMIMQKGAKSIETAMSAREHNKGGKLIWFSDLDLALLSFRLKATYFGLMPVTFNKLQTAFVNCGITVIREII